MRVLIVEDEKPAARRLERLIQALRPETEILEVTDTIEDAVAFFEKHKVDLPDLVFMDIHLADGLSFEIFNRTEVLVPVVFITAFDHYALRAFKVNSIDYLLKPVDEAELEAAFRKFEDRTASPLPGELRQLLKTLSQSRAVFRRRFLVKTAGRIAFVNTEEISYFFSDSGNTFLVTNGSDRFLLDIALDEIEPDLDPARFFRINRAMVVGLHAIRKIDPHFNNRFSLELTPAFGGEVLVSRQRGPAFRQWLDS
jgi:DNA-binding LytR/AlgR family response regulator